MTPANLILPSHKAILHQMRSGVILRRTWGAEPKAFLGDKSIRLETVIYMAGQGLIQITETVNGYTRYTPSFKSRKALRLPGGW